MSTATRERIKRLAGKTVLYVLLSLIGLTLVAYAADSLAFHLSVSRNDHPFGTVTVYSYDAVPQKSGKTQLIFHDPQNQTCVNALFPHAGYEPCWYLKRNSTPKTDM